MRIPRPWLAVPVALFASWIAAAASQATPDIAELMARVGERVAEYYRRAQTVICVERSTVQPVQVNVAPDGFARTVESELRIESGASNGAPLAPKLIRTVRRVNGRAPRDRDAKDRAGCTDSAAVSPDPLAFLLPDQRHTYRFTSVRHGKAKDRSALIIDFTSATRTSRPELVEDERGHDDCFDWSGAVTTRGRVWVDANTFEVLRIERHNTGPVEVRVPWTLQRRYRLPPWVVVDRDDLTVRYKPVAFTEPNEVIVLPESLEALTLVRSGLQSIRRTETFSEYRRFLTTGRIVKGH